MPICNLNELRSPICFEGKRFLLFFPADLLRIGLFNCENEEGCVSVYQNECCIEQLSDGITLSLQLQTET